VNLWASCSVNGVRYNTVDRERQRQTQNNGVLVDGTHNGLATEFYGQLREIVELSYNSSLVTEFYGQLREIAMFDLGDLGCGRWVADG